MYILDYAQTTYVSSRYTAISSVQTDLPLALHLLRFCLSEWTQSLGDADSGIAYDANTTELIVPFRQYHGVRIRLLLVYLHDQT